jgi:hypothetical protein
MSQKLVGWSGTASRGGEGIQTIQGRVRVCIRELDFE